MSLSDSSSALSSPPSSEDEADVTPMTKFTGLDRYFKPKTKAQSSERPAASPPPPKREPSPPHDYVLADNPDIAFIVMFRARFSEAFPRSCPHVGPQDIERGIADTIPGELVEKVLSGILGLVLNRKKDVDRQHYGRALEEAIQTHSSEWPKQWQSKNPLHGGGSFATMTPEERLTLMKTLILWALSSSDAVQAILKASYKGSRREDDALQPLAVHPWGRDAYKRRYWLIEGQDDTHFRVYRESNPALKTNTWWSVAGSIEEIQALSEKLNEDGSQHAKKLQQGIADAIPRFEAGDEKRKRRDYRLARKAQFSRPDPGFSMYEGRTRGKKMRYTFSDDEEDFESDSLPTRRSNRQSGAQTPAEPAGPTFTASGRQVKSRVGGSYGEALLVDQRKDMEQNLEDTEEGVYEGRIRAGRAAANGKNHIEGYNSIDEMDEESDAASSTNWAGGDDDDGQDFDGEDEDDEMSEDEASDADEEDQSLIVQLKFRKGSVTEVNGQLIKSDGIEEPADDQKENPTTTNGTATAVEAAPEVKTEQSATVTEPVILAKPAPASTSLPVEKLNGNTPHVHETEAKQEPETKMNGTTPMEIF